MHGRIVLLLSSLVAVACSSDERYDSVVPQVVAQNTREFIETAVSEPARAQAMVALVDRCEKLTLELDRDQQMFLVEVERTNANPDATTDELRDTLGRALARRRRTSSDLFDAWLELRGIARPDEWQYIVELEAAGLRASVRRERREQTLGKGAGS